MTRYISLAKYDVRLCCVRWLLLCRLSEILRQINYTGYSIATNQRMLLRDVVMANTPDIACLQN